MKTLLTLTLMVFSAITSASEVNILPWKTWEEDIKIAIEAGNDLNKYWVGDDNGSTALEDAVPVLHRTLYKSGGSSSLAQLLVDNGYDVTQLDNRGLTALNYGCAEKGGKALQLEVVTKVVEAGLFDDPAYIIACLDYANIVEYIVSQNVQFDINAEAYGAPLLFHLSLATTPKTLKKFTYLNPDFSRRDNSGNSILHFFATRMSGDDEGMIQYLAASGANVNARNNDSKTPLITAILNGKDELVKPLVEAGAIVRLKLDKGLYWNMKGYTDSLSIVKAQIENPYTDSEEYRQKKQRTYRYLLEQADLQVM